MSEALTSFHQGIVWRQEGSLPKPQHWVSVYVYPFVCLRCQIGFLQPRPALHERAACETYCPSHMWTTSRGRMRLLDWQFACLGIPAPGSTGQNKARRILGDSKSVSRFAAFLLHGHAWWLTDMWPHGCRVWQTSRKGKNWTFRFHILWNCNNIQCYNSII